MEKLLNIIPITYSDPHINSILKEITPSKPYKKLFYNQNEELFIKIDKEIVIPQIPVHHNINNQTPKKEYLEKITNVIKSLKDKIPFALENMTYFFDPSEILRPCFFQLFKIKEKQYLYLLRLDLNFHINQGQLLDKGTNDQTPSFKTNQIYLEGDFIPLKDITIENNKIVSFEIDQIISQTWIGETGRGYLVQGIWIDLELTKFFTKLFVPKNKNIYPYYPFNCKYRTLCHSIFDFSINGRKSGLPFLHQALNFISPEIESIQNSLKRSEFTENLDSFKNIKTRVPVYWKKAWDSFKVTSILNDYDMKEFILEY